MQATLLPQHAAAAPLREHGGLVVRTGLRGGVCGEMNDQVKEALKTVTDALGGKTVAAAPPPAVSATPTTTS